MSTGKPFNPFVDILPVIDPGLIPSTNVQPPSWAIGYGDNAVKVDKQGMWLGANRFVDAPFRVDMDGNGFFRGTIVGSTLTTGDTGENVKITSAYISLRHDTTETGYLRGYQTTDRYGDPLNASELSVKVVAIRPGGSITHDSLDLFDNTAGGGGTIPGSVIAAWNASAIAQDIVVIGSTIYFVGALDGSGSVLLDLSNAVTVKATSHLIIPNKSGAFSGANTRGEIGYDYTNHKIYVGEGGTTWKSTAALT